MRCSPAVLTVALTAALAWFLVPVTGAGSAAEKPPLRDSQPVKVFVRLLGTSS